VLALSQVPGPDGAEVKLPGDVPRVTVGPHDVEGRSDLDYVEVGGHRPVAFLVVNDQARPLEIRKVKSGCECIKLVTGPKVILPRGAGMFVVEFEAPPIRTEYTTEIVLFTSDSSRPMISLSVRARIGLPLGFRPATLDMGRVPLGQRRRKRVALVNGGAAPVRLTAATVTGKECEVSAGARIVPTGGRIMVEVTVLPDGAVGPRRETVVIETDNADQSRLSLPVRFEAVDGKARGGSAEPRDRARRSRTQLCQRG